MSQVDFKEYFKKDYDLLKYIGTWIGEGNDKLPIPYKLYAFCVHVCFILLLNISFFVNWVIKTTSLKQMALIGYIIIPVAGSQFRGFFLLRSRRYFTLINEQYNNEYFLIQNPEEAEMVEKKLRQFKNIRTVLFAIVAIALANSVFTPLFLKTEQSGLPYDSWFPFSVSSFPGYQIAYIFQVISGMYASCMNVCTDIFMGGNCNFVGLQCTLLQMRLKKIGNDGKEYKSSLLDCIHHYLAILRFHKALTNAFGTICFCQLFSCAVALCMGLFLLSLANPGDYEFYFFILYVLVTQGVLFIPCWFSSEMITKSEIIPRAVYDCNWEDGDIAFKKDLLFFLKMTQTPLKLFAVKTVEISMVTFVSVLRASLSYYTVMSNFNASN